MTIESLSTFVYALCGCVILLSIANVILWRKLDESTDYILKLALITKKMTEIVDSLQRQRKCR